MKLELKQQAKLNPELLKSLKLLQLNTLQLRDYLHDSLSDNAMVELEFPHIEANKDPFLDRYTYSASDSFTSSTGTDYDQIINNQADVDSILDDLFMQTAALDLSTAEDAVVRYMIRLLDENGFLHESVEDISDDINAPVNLVKKCLEFLQSLEPAGVGARDLQECLYLQLIREKEPDSIAILIVNEHLSLISSGRYLDIADILGVSKADVINACERIKSLSPKPLNGLQTERTTKYILPDFYVIEDDGQLRIIVNDYYLPKITFQQDYVELLKKKQFAADEHEYLNRDYKEAKDITRFLTYRKSTLLSLVEAVVDKQKDFFLLGPGHRKPLYNRDIAKLLSLHESTVSRLVSEKHFKCKWGVFPLRYLFLHMVGDNNEIGPDFIKSRILQLVKDEPKSSPYSDLQLYELLKGEGLNVSRRTVAKYRGELRIPTFGKRKKKPTDSCQ